MVFCRVRPQASAYSDKDFNSIVSNEKLHFIALEIINLCTRNIIYLDFTIRSMVKPRY
jgi:hypothetical protein